MMSVAPSQEPQSMTWPTALATEDRNRRWSALRQLAAMALAMALVACGGAQPKPAPMTPRAQILQAMKLGDLAHAETMARALAKSGEPRHDLLLDEVLLRRGKHAEAARRLEPRYRKHPQNADLAGLYARALDALGRRAKAVVAYARRLRLVPTDPRAALRMGTLLLAQGDALHASQIAAAGSRSHPRHAGLRVLNARALLRRGRLAGAQKAANAALQIKPEQVAGWLVLARIQIGLGERTEAERSVQRGLTYDRQRVDALRLLASLRAARGAPNLAVITLKRALAVQPDNPTLLNAIATQRFRLGQTSLAIAALRKAIEIAPKQLVLRRNLAELLLASSRIQEAAQVARGAAALAREAEALAKNVRTAVEETLARTICAEVLFTQICKGVRDGQRVGAAVHLAFAHENIPTANIDALAAEVAPYVKRATAQCRRPRTKK